MIENEIHSETEQPRTRRDVVRLGAALLATGLGLASLTGAAARELEPGDDTGAAAGGGTTGAGAMVEADETAAWKITIAVAGGAGDGAPATVLLRSRRWAQGRNRRGGLDTTLRALIITFHAADCSAALRGLRVVLQPDSGDRRNGGSHR